MSVKKWKFIRSKEVFEHPRLKLQEDVVELPDGHKTTYLREAPRAHKSVAIIALNDKDEILLQKEYSYPPNEVMWQLPGGTIEEGEDMYKAANRELMEESGLYAYNCTSLGFYYTNNRRSDQKQFVILCTNLAPREGKPDPEEFIENTWLPVSRVEVGIAQGEFTNINLLAALNLWLHSPQRNRHTS